MGALCLAENATANRRLREAADQNAGERRDDQRADRQMKLDRQRTGDFRQQEGGGESALLERPETSFEPLLSERDNGDDQHREVVVEQERRRQTGERAD